MIPPLDLVGQRFGYLTVLSRSERPRHLKRIGTYWQCQCDCGAMRTLNADRLTSGNTKSCGNHRAGPPGTSGAHAIFCQYRWNARTRGLIFDLTKEQFLTLTRARCYYCGSPPQNVSRCGGNSTAETFAKSLYVYSGIDRVDNSRGYVDGNYVPCCKLYNGAKSGMRREDFLKWVAAVYRHSIAKRGSQQPRHENTLPLGIGIPADQQPIPWSTP